MYYYRPRPRTSTRPRPSTSRDDLRQNGAHTPTTTTTEAPEPSESQGATTAQGPAADLWAEQLVSTLDTETLLYLLAILYRPSKTEEEAHTAASPSPIEAAEDLVVESTPPPAAPGEEDDTADMADSSAPRFSHKSALVGGLLLVLCVLTPLAVIVTYLIPLLSVSATVTIIPVQRAITATTQLAVVTSGPANLTQKQVPGRRLSALTLSQQETVPTTGVGHQPARAAQGTITFYNAAPYLQTIGAGTLLTGSDGIQVVTEQDAVIPAVAYPTLGQVTVSAHAVIAGPAGNIRAGDIYGPCCRLNVSAVSTAFSGGQDARHFPMVTTQDMSTAVSTLKASLAQSVEAAFAAQLHEGETLITPVPCTPTVSADHAIGGEAARLTVTVDATCTGESYRTQAMHDMVKQIVTQQASTQLGTGYALSGDVQVSITHVSRTAQGTVRLAVTGSGTWGYQFSQDELEHIKTLLAGKSEPEARALVLQMEGVQSVSITLTQTATMPTDTSRIHLVLVEMP